MSNQTIENTETASTADVTTQKASRFLKALCNHFDRKTTASYTDDRGYIAFDFGRCDLTAGESSLHIIVTAESAELLERTKHVVASHLIRFGQKDELSVEWQS